MTSATSSWLKLAAISFAIALAGCQGSDSESPGGDAAPAAEADAAANPIVVMTTNLGSVEIELFPDKAPETVENFLKYVDDGFYNGTIFHRVIPSFMIQGGGYEENRNRKETREPVKNEADNGLKNEVGTIAMARTSIPDSATAQFFINVKDNGFLDHKSKTPQGYGYAVFGKVAAGMDVVKAIENSPTEDGGGAFKNLPKEPITIESMARR